MELNIISRFHSETETEPDKDELLEAEGRFADITAVGVHVRYELHTSIVHAPPIRNDTDINWIISATCIQGCIGRKMTVTFYLHIEQTAVERINSKSRLIKALPSLDHFTSGVDELSVLKRELKKQRKKSARIIHAPF